MFIYKQYNQASLDRQFNNRLQTPGYATHFERWELLSRQSEKKYKVVKDIAYGTQSRERLDIYPSLQPSSKTLIFIHGGYWRSMDKASFQFIADAFHSDNVTTVLINYPLAPDVSIDEVVNSCRLAVHWVLENIETYNGDPEQLYLAGHSAGGHLAAMLMTPGLHNPGGKNDLFKGVCALSGLFNLLPVQLSYLNDSLQMDKEMALRNSPVRLQPVVQCPLLLFVGADETNEFKEQSQELYNSWNERMPVRLLQISGQNHFSIIEALVDESSSLHFSIRELMKL